MFVSTRSPTGNALPMLAIHCDGHGMPGGRDRPTCFDLKRAGIDRYDLIFIFQIVIDHSLAVATACSGAAEGKGPDRRALRRINRRAAIGIALENKDALGGRIVNNGVGIRRCFYATENLQRFQIEHDRFDRISVADKSASLFRRHGNSVIALQPRNRANESAAFRIEHLDFSAVREVNAARRRIERDVIKILAAAPSREIFRSKWYPSLTWNPKTDTPSTRPQKPPAKDTKFQGFISNLHTRFYVIHCEPIDRRASCRPQSFVWVPSAFTSTSCFLPSLLV